MKYNKNKSSDEIKKTTSKKKNEIEQQFNYIAFFKNKCIYLLCILSEFQ